MKVRTYKVYRYWIYLDPDPEPWSYVGRTSLDLNERAGGLTGKKYLENCSRFGAAIETYGFPAFSREILIDGLSKEEAKDYEQFYIEKFNSIDHGWNTLSGRTDPEENFKTHFSYDHKNKIRDALKGRHLPEAQRLIMAKAVLQYTRDGQFVAEYLSVKDAAQSLGVSRSFISIVCSGKRQFSKDCILRFKDD